MIEVTDMQKIGVGMCAFGIGIFLLGIVLLFDKGLLALGNILFIAGLACTVGFVRCFRFFFQLQKIKGSIFFFCGIVIVLIGWPVVGILFELYGFYSLFGGFLPTVIVFLRRTPVIGTLLNLPVISQIVQRISGENSGRAMV